MNDTELKQAAPESAFMRLYGIIRRLRGPDGCPWDREQTPASLRGSLAEEAWECVEAIGEGDAAHICEELGDLFLLATMLSYMHEEQGAFSVADVLGGIAEKLIRRHPHVFGGAPPAPDSAQVLKNWARIKVEEEGRPPRDSALDAVPRSLPPLERAFKLQKKAAAQGFDWPGIAGALGKIREELAEVEAAMPDASGGAGELEGELGDLLFSVVNLCRRLGVEPGVALQRTNAKFTARFRHIEKRMKETGHEMSAANLALMDEFWNEAKSLL